MNTLSLLCTKYPDNLRSTTTLPALSPITGLPRVSAPHTGLRTTPVEIK